PAGAEIAVGNEIPAAGAPCHNDCDYRARSQRSCAGAAAGRFHALLLCGTYTPDRMQTPVPETDIVKRIVAERRGRPGPLLEVLHAIQGELGYIPGAAVP